MEETRGEWSRATAPATVFGDLLRRSRCAARLTLEELAERAGLSPRGLSYLEHGLRQPHRATVARLAEALALAPEDRAALEWAARAAIPADERDRRRSHGQPRDGAGRHTMPLYLAAFLGRTRELAHLTRLLRDVRLVTLTGPGGVGKTRLAVQAAAAVSSQFPDGVWFVDLAPLQDPQLVLPAIARTLDVRGQGGHLLGETLRDYLRERHLLLILDNVEHLVAAEHSIALLLQGAPRLTVLATSRVVLGIYGEQIYQVDPLSLPPAGQPPNVSDGQHYDAVRLFVERACAAHNDFTLTAENAAAVVALCRHLDGLPLAIELAAMRLRTFPPAALLQRLSSRLALLTGGARTLPARQQTLRATLAWSHDLLTPIEQTLFRRLAVFRGGCTLEAALAVCAGANLVESSLVDGLASLIDKSLLRQDGADTGEPRFTLLETMREYALEQLAASGEEARLGDRHGAYFLLLAETADLDLDKGKDQVLWYARLERDHDNLRAALQRSLTRSDVERALRLSSALFLFWHGHDHRVEGRRYLEAALALGATAEAGGALPLPLATARVRALAGAGWFTTYDDLPRALGYLEQSLAQARQLQEPRLLAKVLEEYAGATRVQGDPEQATALLEEDARLSREIGDHHELGRSLAHLGLIAYVRGDDERAVTLMDEALGLLRAAGEQRWTGWTLRYLGRLATKRGAYHEARGHFAEGYALIVPLEDISTLILLLEGSAALAAAQDDGYGAALLFGAAAALRDPFGSPRGPTLPPEFDHAVDAARRRVGETVWSAGWADGQALSAEQAIACALHERGRPASAEATPGPARAARRGPHRPATAAKARSSRSISGPAG